MTVVTALTIANPYIKTKGHKQIKKATSESSEPPLFLCNLNLLKFRTLQSRLNHGQKHPREASELVQLKLNIGTAVGESTPTETGYVGPTPTCRSGSLTLWIKSA
ncbi:Hypothetical protein DEACI_2941 [Acididesulfobacillus acetoxydans]|uniref:Uncharacterized protein n=1 Tax=Acididesulfobacillus acetoxydans TaxID=1561005 RepID=A0A8S0W461_9FIRM|nr:Hypothetical protein DEACI_2941 [Acididesulfobacillus acetoxydans]CEJ07514.1 Hypothetical protein DEACI_1980 [Acididesulfobacillus acetoxydans]